MSRLGPIGYFVHHQGRGHAERAAALANEIVRRRPVTLFCARDDIFPNMDERIEIVTIPSLFEPTGIEASGMANMPMPRTTHCAPIGWPSIIAATARISSWFAERAPALFITDVSAELAQLSRLCAVPHVCVLQHGDRSDPGHMAAYEGAVGLLAPYADRFEQDDRPRRMQVKTHYAPGVGIELRDIPTQPEARKALGLSSEREIILVIAGSGGDGTPAAPLTLGARAEPDTRWITIGETQSSWHETSPGNLEHRGWVNNPEQWIAAADRIVSSCGNTTAHMVLGARKPWVVVPEWRYFDEQLCKAAVLEREGCAAVSPHWPSHRNAWDDIWATARALDPNRQKNIADPDAAEKAAEWLEDLCERIWAGYTENATKLEIVA